MKKKKLLNCFQINVFEFVLFFFFIIVFGYFYFELFFFDKFCFISDYCELDLEYKWSQDILRVFYKNIVKIGEYFIC